MAGKEILFLQRHPFPYFGIMSISALLKKEGFKTQVLISALERDILKKIREISPDIIGFSVMTPDLKWLFNLSARIKQEQDITIVVGGAHSSCCPEVVEYPFIDYAVVGEGEYVFTRFLKLYFDGQRELNLEGLVTKATSKQYYKRGGLVPDLNELPMEDRDIYYDRYPSLREVSLKQFISGRGCFFECNFCFNSFYKTLFEERGEYVRRKSPAYFVEEIKKVKESYSLKSLFFADDLFISNRKWLFEFAGLFSKKIGLPFMCTAAADLVTEETAGALKEAGCNCVSFGIETGNEEKRRDVLNKHVSDDSIRRCAAVLKRHGLKIQTSNIFAFPGETIDDAFRTIRLNSEIGTDYMFSTLMMPLPKTKLEKIAKEEGLLPKDYDYTLLPDSFHSKSVFRFKDVEVLENIHKISYLAMKLPRGEKIFRWMVKKNWKVLFFILFAVGFFYRYKSERKMSARDALKLFWDFRKSY